MTFQTLMILMLLLPAAVAVLIWSAARRSGLAWAWALIGSTAVFILSVIFFLQAWQVGPSGEPLAYAAGDFVFFDGLSWVEEFGLLTLPMMALSAFAAIITLSLAARPSRSPS